MEAGGALQSTGRRSLPASSQAPPWHCHGVSPSEAPPASPLPCCLSGPLVFAIGLPVPFPGQLTTSLPPSELEVTPVSPGGSEALAAGSTPQLDATAPLTPLRATLSAQGQLRVRGFLSLSVSPPVPLLVLDETSRSPFLPLTPLPVPLPSCLRPHHLPPGRTIATWGRGDWPLSIDPSIHLSTSTHLPIHSSIHPPVPPPCSLRPAFTPSRTGPCCGPHRVRSR